MKIADCLELVCFSIFFITCLCITKGTSITCCQSNTWWTSGTKVQEYILCIMTTGTSVKAHILVWVARHIFYRITQNSVYCMNNPSPGQMMSIWQLLGCAYANSSHQLHGNLVINIYTQGSFSPSEEIPSSLIQPYSRKNYHETLWVLSKLSNRNITISKCLLLNTYITWYPCWVVLTVSIKFHRSSFRISFNLEHVKRGFNSTLTNVI